MTISIIVAMTLKGLIGNKQRLPWPPVFSDIRHFRKTTLGHPVIMGSRTFFGITEALGKPLEGRENIVLTTSNTRNVENQGGIAVPSPEAALAYAKRKNKDKEMFVIGGSQVYERFLPLANKAYVTRIFDAEHLEGDAYFDIGPRWAHIDATNAAPMLRDPADSYRSGITIYSR